MGELVYTNQEGLVKASGDFSDTAENIEQIKETISTALNNFTEDMLGSASEPMCNCTSQMDVQLFAVNTDFTAISNLLLEVMEKRCWMDNDLALNAAGKLTGTGYGVVAQSMLAITSVCNLPQQQLKKGTSKGER